MLVDYVSRKKRTSSAEVPLDKGDLGRQRLPAKAVRPWCRRSSADFGSPRTIFHQIIGHGRHALKNLGPGFCARFRRMNHVSLVQRPDLQARFSSDPFIESTLSIDTKLNSWLSICFARSPALTWERNVWGHE